MMEKLKKMLMKNKLVIYAGLIVIVLVTFIVYLMDHNQVIAEMIMAGLLIILTGLAGWHLYMI